MKGLKYLGGLLAVGLSLSLFSGCASQSSSVLNETTVVMSESTEDAEQNNKSETVGTGLLVGNYDADDLDESWSEGKATIIKCNGESSEISGNGIQADGNILKITQAGTYVFSGKMSDGQIQVNADKNDVVHIVLGGLTASSGSSSVIYGIQSKKIVITLAKGQENVLNDASSYVYKSVSENEPNACIFSKDDVSINGEGSLDIYGNYGDGVCSKGDLKIINGTYRITAAQNGLQAETVLQINGGSGSITSGGGSSNASYDENGQIQEKWGQWGGQMGEQEPADSEVPGAGRTSVEESGISTEDSGSSDSAKGLKGGVGIYLNGGDFTIDSSDDSIHCNGSVTVNDGTYIMDSGDDGIHADQALIINGGILQINKSYEGLEGMTVDIRDGEINVTSIDDGINSAGGSDTLKNGRPGQNSFASEDDCWIRISGGDIYVKASGDGIDSNRNLYMDGGMLVVEGPEDSANGTLDYEGKAEITGGTFIGTGSSGMAMDFSNSSTQCSVNVVVDTMLPSGTMVTVTDSSGKDILSVSPTKSFNCIQISSSLLVYGETYTVTYGDGDSKEIRLDGVSVWSGANKFPAADSG